MDRDREAGVGCDMAVITGRVKAEPDAPEDRSEGVIYACVEEGDQFVKIGWAASVENAYARWISIQIGNPRRIKMHLIGDGSLHDEAALHGQLRQHAIRGEWFRIEGAVETVLAKARPLPPRAFGAGRPPTERTAAEQWLIRALASGPRSAGELFAAGVEAGHSQKTVRRAADALAVLRDPPGGGRRCRWMLPLGDTTGPDA